MSKLFKLKEWLTIEEAAKHLTVMLGEAVSEADVFRLALDKHLILSMSFPNKARGNLGKIVSLNEALTHSLSEDALKALIRSVNAGEQPEISLIGDRISDSEFLIWGKQVESIEGVWDLPMIGSERLDVEHVYQQLTCGPDITLTCLGGALVKREERFVRLVEGFDENELTSGSLAARRILEMNIVENNLSAEKQREAWEEYDSDRKAFLGSKAASDFYPAGGLPADGIYVVRTAVIVDFLNRINEAPAHEKPLSTKERNSMLALIAALCNAAGFDYTQRGIASSLVVATETLGKPLTDDTIRNILKQAKELLQ